MEMKAALEDLDAKTHKIEKEIDRNKETLLLKEAEIQELNAKLNEQSKQMTTHGALKVVINLRELKKDWENNLQLTWRKKNHNSNFPPGVEVNF